MVTIKGGVLKGGTTKKKKHYMDNRLPQQMSATGASAGTKVVSRPKKLEGALNQSKAEPSKPKPSSSPKKTGPSNTPKRKPSRSSKPMPASMPRASGKAPVKRKTSISISHATAIGRGLSYIISGSPTRTNEQRKKRAQKIRESSK